MMTLQELAAAVEAQQKNKVDLIVPDRALKVEVIETDNGPLTAVDIPGKAIAQPTDWAQGQMASHLGIPRQYWSRMAQQAPQLLAENANHWLQESDDRMMVRLMGSDLRAYVSNKFKRLDHDIALTEALQAVQENNKETETVVLGSHVDPMGESMHIKILFPGVTGEVREGDVMRSGVMISNSEVGGGTFHVRGFLWRDYCRNGMIYGSTDIIEALRKRHIGPRIENIFADDTLEAEAKLLGKQTRDIMRTLSSQEALDKMLEPCKRAAQSAEIVDPEAAIQVVTKEIGLTDMERQRALISLIQERDMTQYGMANAVTQLAHTASFNRAIELESAGAKLLTMDLNRWKNRVALAA